MSIWSANKHLFGDEIVLRSIDWLENFPWRNDSAVKAEKDKYEIALNVKDFEPKDIIVKTSDGFIVVEGKHEEKKDEHGFVSRQFVRRYALPSDCRPESVSSRLSSDGTLIVTAPRRPVVKRDTVIPVSHEDNKNVKSKL